MRDLTVRLDAIDPEAGAALRVISYFDSLVAHEAGLHALLRAAAVLTAGPAVLVDEARSVRVRVGADGRLGQPVGVPHPSWPTLELPTTRSTLWLEYDGPVRAVDALVLERLAAAVEPLLLRTRGRRDAPHRDEASIEVLILDGSAPEARAAAVRRLGLPSEGLVRAVAVHDGTARLWTESPGATDSEALRAGVGPAVPVDGLPQSWRQARAALRLTAAGTQRDPGPRLVVADEVGSQLLLAELVDADTPAPADVLALERAAAALPWLLETMEVMAYSVSTRAAASRLGLHHSTAQERAARAARLLGWDVDEPAGRLRLQLALAVRRLRTTTRE